MRRAIHVTLSFIVLTTIAACAAPIVPQRSRPGGSAHWAEALALRVAVRWAPDATLCHVVAAGIGSDGWLPDRGGSWTFIYWSTEKQPLLEVAVDAEGGVSQKEDPDAPQRGQRIPAEWADSPRVWSATRAHQRSEPVHTFEAELGLDLEPERFPGRTVWRIRFWMDDSTFETHVVTPEAEWLATY